MDSWGRTAGTGQLGQDSQGQVSQGRKARTKHLEKVSRLYIQDRKERTGGQNITARTKQLWQVNRKCDKRGRTAGIKHLRQDH